MTRRERLAQDKAVNPVLFYHGTGEWGCFSNFSIHSVSMLHPWTGEPFEYETSEHRYQAMKATSHEDHDAVALTKRPIGAKNTGRVIQLRDDWGDTQNSVCWFVMMEVCLAKAVQHSDVLHNLAATEDRWMYEDSPIDDIWGWRYQSDYSGQNLLGLTWMHVRQILLPV